MDDFLRKIISSLVGDAMLEQDVDCLRSDNCMLCTIREAFARCNEKDEKLLVHHNGLLLRVVWEDRRTCGHRRDSWIPRNWMLKKSLQELLAAF